MSSSIEHRAKGSVAAVSDGSGGALSFRQNRFDVAEISKSTRTPQGFLRVAAFLTRAGVFSYRRADGTTVRELRPHDEVFKADSLATLASAPVTDLHPTEMVTPVNVRKLSIGHVSEAARRDGHLVLAAITIEDDAAIKAVERGDRREVSCGYQCRIDATPGTYDGEAYDVVQRDIIYNHAALGPRGWGRQGRDVALRIDSQDDADGIEQVFRLDAHDALCTETFEFGVASSSRDRTRNDNKGAADMTQTSKDTEQQRFDAAVHERATAIAAASGVLRPDFKFDLLSVRQIHEAALKEMGCTTDFAGKGADSVWGAFDACVSARARTQDTPRRDQARSSRTLTWTEAQARLDEVGARWPAPEWQKPLSTSAPRTDATHPTTGKRVNDWERPLSMWKDDEGNVFGADVRNGAGNGDPSNRGER